MGPIIMQAYKGEGVWEPAPVNTLIYPVKARYLLIGDVAQLQVLEHIAAGAHGFAQVFVAVFSFVCSSQVVRFYQELLAQPLSWGLKVCASIA